MILDGQLDLVLAQHWLSGGNGILDTLEVLAEGVERVVLFPTPHRCLGVETKGSGRLARLERHPELERPVLAARQRRRVEDELHAVALHLLTEFLGRLQLNALERRLSAPQAERMAVLDHGG